MFLYHIFKIKFQVSTKYFLFFFYKLVFLQAQHRMYSIFYRRLCNLICKYGCLKKQHLFVAVHVFVFTFQINRRMKKNLYLIFRLCIIGIWYWYPEVSSSAGIRFQRIVNYEEKGLTLCFMIYHKMCRDNCQHGATEGYSTFTSQHFHSFW